MRQSRYTVVEHAENGEHLLFNTANGAFAALDDDAFACFEACDGPHVPELAQWGFLTELTPDEELDAWRRRVEANRADRSVLTLSFVPTYACNFRCPYCYEQDRVKLGGKMDSRTMDAVVAFARAHYEQDGFSKLSVQWYGGDPSLVLDAVEELSMRLISFCDEEGVDYEAMMLTNANAIGVPEADAIVRCRIGQVLLTIDGPEEIHNRRRVAGNGTNSYQKTMHAARLLRARGVCLSATMNVDRVNWPHYVRMRDQLLSEEGILLNAGRLCDYGHTFGTAPFSKPQFDLFTHDEFCQERLQLFESEAHTADELRMMLAPILQFCQGQSGSYFVIDFKGDVFSCDGWIGYPERVRFNVHDDPSEWKTPEIVFDAPLDEKCSPCELLPLCMGNCIWEREATGMPCHPLKGRMGSYLRVYRSCFGEGQPGVTLLASQASNSER